jgi:hypothetical protein
LGLLLLIVVYIAVVVVEMSGEHLPYKAIQTDTVENFDKFKSAHLLQTNLRDWVIAE